jgi:hypothetical protein
MAAVFIQDGNLLWLMVEKVGSPLVWNGGTNYEQGDVVIPRFPVSGQENIMFQVVGYIGSSGAAEPSFPILAGQTVEDSGIEWTARKKTDSPLQLGPNEYFEIHETVTAV